VYDLPRAALDPAAPAEDDARRRRQRAPRSSEEELAGAAAASDADTASAATASNTDAHAPALRVAAGEAVYDFCWFSRAAAADPASLCFAAARRAHPVGLWDAASGRQRAAYAPWDRSKDEPAPAHSVAFSADGGALFAGGRGGVAVFDVGRPGRDHGYLKPPAEAGGGRAAGRAIVSCLAAAPAAAPAPLLAAGLYSGAAALYDPRTAEALFLLEGHAGGVAHVRFGADGNHLYTSARREGAIYCWDARAPAAALYALARPAGASNQRLRFDVEPAGRHLAAGGADGAVRLFDLRDGAAVGAPVATAADTVTGCMFHPFLPLLAAASGHRRYPLAPADGASSGDDEGGGGGAEGLALGPDENVLRVLRFQTRAGGDEAAACGAGQECGAERASD
jgi:hypothetical protein